MKFYMLAQARTRGGGGGRATPRTPPPPTSNYRVPPAHRFHKYKLRLLYFRMQILTPYSIKFIKKILVDHTPRPFQVDTAPMARVPPPPPPPPPPRPINNPPPWSTLGTGLLASNTSYFIYMKMQRTAVCLVLGVHSGFPRVWSQQIQGFLRLFKADFSRFSRPLRTRPGAIVTVVH